MSLEQRRLAAILAADVVGYSRLVGEDERGTLARLAELRQTVIDPEVARHRGRIFKAMGDGFLVEFQSAVQAVACAVEIQKSGQALPLRIGIHVGDVVVQGDDLMGDGVNIAARIEGVAEAGGIAISRQVHDQVRDKVAFGFEDKGEVSLKNIARPVRVFVIAGARVATTAPALALPDKPSIAVLPFQNMSGDPEQEYFADGVVEDIITALSRFKSLFVIARNSSFTYKGRAVDIKQVGRELGVRYVLEGSVRKSGNRVRITGQLIDSATGAHLWAENFDGLLEVVFDLQDRVSQGVVGLIAPKLEQAEIDRIRSKPTGSLDAYDHLLRGIANLAVNGKPAVEAALKHFNESIRLDPGYAAAYGWASVAYSRLLQSGWLERREEQMKEGVRLGRKAIELGKDDALALAAGGLAIAFMGRDFDGGRAAVDRALQLNPNLALAWVVSGWVANYAGEAEKAFEHLTRALRLNPLDPQIEQSYLACAIAMRLARRYDEAIAWANRALQQNPDLKAAMINLAISLAMSGRLDEAREITGRLLRIDPGLRVSNTNFVYRRPKNIQAMWDGLRLAGLPE